MAGRPQRRSLIAKVKGFGGGDRICELVEQGVSLASVAREIGCSREHLSIWMNGDPDRRKRLARARETAAEALVDQGLAIIDRADIAETQLAKARADYRRWMASRLDPDTWGERQQGPQIAIQFNGLHLDSLRQLRQPLEHDGDD